jgi:putative ABC transport system substrate-binding protein
LATHTRRQFLIATGALVASSTLDAQPRKTIARIGSLSLRREPGPQQESFERILRELGWVKGQNIVIEYRWAANDVNRLPILANELIGLKPALIVAWGTPVVHAVRDATRTIPIVMAGVADPVGSGFVTSLARPGGRITGTSLMGPDLAGKRLELLREIVPDLRRVGFLAHGNDPAHKLFIAQTEDAARTLGIQIQALVIKGVEEIDNAFVTMHNDRTRAVIVQPLFIGSLGQGPRIAQLAIKNKMPTISDGFPFADAGGLIYYGSERGELARRTASFVDKILRGAQPSDLPVEQPTRFELVVNMKTAKALALTIPPSVLVRAERIIE